MKKPLLIAVGAIVLVGLVVASMLGGKRGKGTKVYVEKAERRAITQTVRASGQIQPRVKVHISSHVIGKIERLFVEEGQSVAAGEPLLELERPAFQAERDTARAQVVKSESEVRQTEIALADQANRLARAKRLAVDGISSAEALEAAQLAYDSARLRVDQARESAKQARAVLVRAEDDLRKTTIYSPISGRVIALHAEEGEVVVSGTMNNPASVIGTIADLSEILAEIDVDETEIVHLALGQPATVRVDALPETSDRGRVVEIGSSGESRPAQPDVTFYRVKILLEAPNTALRPGMSARADVEVATHGDAVTVPIQSVVERRDEAPRGAGRSSDAKRSRRQVVYVVEQGRAREREVRPGISDATHVEIIEGLAGGEEVVTGPFRALRKLAADEAVQITRPDLETERAEPESDKEKS